MITVKGLALFLQNAKRYQNYVYASYYYQKSLLENTNQVNWNRRFKAVVVFKTYIALQCKLLQSTSYADVAATSRE